MNKYVRAFFLPIMILAGIFTCTMCVIITGPLALKHWLQERKLAPTDIANDEKYVAAYHEQLKS